MCPLLLFVCVREYEVNGRGLGLSPPLNPGIRTRIDM